MNLNFKIIAPTNLAPSQANNYSFDELGGTIGRKPGNDFVLNDPERYISGKHAVIEFRNKHFYITDTSTNGVYLNNAKQPIGAGNSAEIMNGDKITIGAYQLLAHISDNKAAPVENKQWQMPASTPPQPVVYHDPLEGLVENAVDMHDKNFAASHSVDPLELLGDSNQSPNVPFASDANHGSKLGTPNLDDLFGETEPYIEEKPVGTIPDDIFADLLGPSLAEKAESKPQPVTIDEQFSPPSNFIPEDWDLMDSNDNKIHSKPSLSTNESAPAAGNAYATINPKSNIPPSSPGPSVEHTQTESSDTLLRAFLQGAGVDLTQIRFKDQLHLMRKLGEITRINTEGLMQALRARSTIKSNFRVSKTIISPVENNPLKFSVTTDDALNIIFSDDRKGYMSGTEAFKQGFSDLQSHQMALMAGMQATVSTIIDQLNPAMLEKSFEATSGSSFIPGQKKSRNWDSYVDFYNRLKDRLQDDFQNVYGEEFARAYEEQILKLTR